jgi:Flp pilus assembly secretin CpaC
LNSLLGNKSSHFQLLFFIILLLFPRPPRAAAEQPETPAAPPAGIEAIITKETVIEMKTGERKRVAPEAKALDVAVTRPEVVDGYLSGDQELMLVANSPGVGKIILQLDSGNTIAYVVRVYVADIEKFAAELKEKLKNIQNLNIEVVKEKVLVAGRILYLKDMDAIERAIGDNPSIINLTSLSSRNATILAREIERELRESGIYGVEVEVRNNRVTLVGALASATLIRKAEHIASTYTPNFDSLLRTGD